MKYLISLVISLFAVPLCRCGSLVIDPTAIANNQASHIVDLAKYVEMVNNQLKQITTDDAGASTGDCLCQSVRRSIYSP